MLHDIIQSFRDTNIVKKELEVITSVAKDIKRDVFIMEVCGTHTMQISKFGLRKLLPKNIKLISGPGCPVCVTPIEYVDKAIYIVRNYNVILATFGDLFRVPGSESSLEKEKSDGKDVRIVYSPEEIIALSKESQDKDIVFLSIGFETTMPGIAAVAKEIKDNGINNVYFLLGNKFFLPALEVLILHSRSYILSNINTTSSIDGFILPGHLSSIIGEKSYLWISKKYNLPGVITGFEPLDILRGIRMILEMIIVNKPEIKNEYTRVVTYEGNIDAKKFILEVFTSKSSKWRGIGVVPDSGVEFKEGYKQYDAEIKFGIPKINNISEFTGCRCNDVLIGKITPFECALFATVCTPENPKGACMVSQEGACAAYYKYERDDV
ncbi:MAG: hydrogenase formation protein HypD [Endomicrobia bacterium]|nr:hydrogenase formation protein HypD [Endomicrobiia bacterium]